MLLHGGRQRHAIHVQGAHHGLLAPEREPHLRDPDSPVNHVPLRPEPYQLFHGMSRAVRPPGHAPVDRHHNGFGLPARRNRSKGGATKSHQPLSGLAPTIFPSSNPLLPPPLDLEGAFRERSERPRWLHEGLRTLQMASKIAQDSPTWLQLAHDMRPRGSSSAPRRLQEVKEHSIEALYSRLFLGDRLQDGPTGVPRTQEVPLRAP